MKKKSNGDASSIPIPIRIPVFTPANIADKNSTLESLSKVPGGSSEETNSKEEVKKFKSENTTVSARALYEFLAINERFSRWYQRMFSHGFVENVDYMKVNYLVIGNNGAKNEFREFLLTLDTAKEICMMQRNEKGRKARQYFINIEKLYLKNVHSESIERSVDYFAQKEETV